MGFVNAMGTKVGDAAGEVIAQGVVSSIGTVGTTGSPLDERAAAERAAYRAAWAPYVGGALGVGLCVAVFGLRRSKQRPLESQAT
jgi:hypothetical protein